MSSYTVKENLTTINYNEGNDSKENKYIVILSADNNNTAKDNTEYFKSINRKSSANFFVDENPTVWMCVHPKNISWHCGTSGTYLHRYCRNSNSIGIELCLEDFDWQNNALSKTERHAAELTADLMKKYNIPIENVIRHYDVTHKMCPEFYVKDISRWNNFKKTVLSFF